MSSTTAELTSAAVCPEEQLITRQGMGLVWPLVEVHGPCVFLSLPHKYQLVWNNKGVSAHHPSPVQAPKDTSLY